MHAHTHLCVCNCMCILYICCVGSRILFCSPRLACSMMSHVAKESCDCPLLMTCCVCVCVANIETHTLTENHHVSWKNIKSIKSSNSKSIIGMSWTSFAMLGSPYSSIGLTWELRSKIACFVCLFSSLFATSPWLLYILVLQIDKQWGGLLNTCLLRLKHPSNQWERDWALARIQGVTIHQAIAICHVHRRRPCGPQPCRRKIKTNW